MSGVQEYAHKYPLQFMAAHNPVLLGLLLDAPLLAVRARWPEKLHAVTMDGLLGRQGRTHESACGLTGLRLVAGGQGVALWPPRLRGLPDGYERCRDCWTATGRMRPRTEWRSDV